MPQSEFGVLFVALSIRKADEFKLHSPWRKKVNPGLAGIWPNRPDCRCTQEPDPLFGEVGNRRIEIINIEGQMMAAYIAVLRLNEVLIGSLVFKDLEIRPVLAAKEPQPTHNSARVNVEMLLHPIIGCLKGSKFKHILTADYIHEKVCRLRQVWNCEADVFSSSEARNTRWLAFPR